MNGMNEILFGAKISVIGFSIVFLALIAVALVLGFLSRLDEMLEKSMQKAEAAKAGKDSTDVEKPPIVLDRTELSPEDVAVITAAVAVAIDKRFRIQRIRFRSPFQKSSWSVHGRTTVMASHVVK